MRPPRPPYRPTVDLTPPRPVEPLGAPPLGSFAKLAAAKREHAAETAAINARGERLRAAIQALDFQPFASRPDALRDADVEFPKLQQRQHEADVKLERVRLGIRAARLDRGGADARDRQQRMTWAVFPELAPVDDRQVPFGYRPAPGERLRPKSPQPFVSPHEQLVAAFIHHLETGQ
jgi:hypothetical protein